MNAVNKFVIVVLILLNHTVVSSQPVTRKVLFIGNSYIYVNNLPQITSDVALSMGDSLIFDSYTVGSYTLELHSTDPNTLGKIMNGGWDYVVMQEQSQRPSFDTYDSYYAYVLSQKIRQYNTCARKMFYMTWGRKNGDASNCVVWPPVCTYEGMDSLLRLRYLEIASDNNAEVSPVGAVWNYLRHNNPGIELYQADESHPSEAGSYAAACCFYSAIYKKDPSLIPYNYTLDTATAMAIRNAAKAVVFDSLSNWDFVHYNPVADFTYWIGNGVNEVVLANYSTGADTYTWDFGDATFSSDTSTFHSYGQDGQYIITLTASDCDLGQVYQSTAQDTVTFCSFNPTIFPDSLFICPNATDTLSTQSYDSYQWLNDNMQPIAGEVGQYFLPSSGGFYCVETTLNGCTEISPFATVNSFFAGNVLFYTDSFNTSIHPDSTCLGDTVFLVLNSNKPYGNDFILQWHKDGVPVSLAVDDTLLVTADGTYFVSIYNTYCPGYIFYTSQTYVVDFINCNIGIEEAKSASRTSVFPNPAHNFIILVSENLEDGREYFLRNVYGQIIQRGFIEKEKEKVNIVNMFPGIYFLQIESQKGGTELLKLIVE